MLILVAYVVSKISRSSFRLSIALARVFSFSVEMESHLRMLTPGGSLWL